jgi:hypothetical protein
MIRAVRRTPSRSSIRAAAARSGLVSAVSAGSVQRYAGNATFT